MLSRPPGKPAQSATRAAGSDTPEPAGDGSPPATDSEIASAQPSSGAPTETRRERVRRKAHRWRLHGYAILAVILVAFLMALAASNTARVKVNWVFASSHVPLVWLVLLTAILGWLLGLAVTATVHWRTRAPRRRRGG